MVRLHGGDSQRPDPAGLARRQLDRAGEPEVGEERTRPGGDEDRHVAVDPAQRGGVGVVVVQMGDQQRVEVPRDPARRRVPPAPQRADARTEHRVGEQAGPAELEQHGGVADVGDPVRRRHVRESACVEERGIEVQTGALSGIFAAPKWMRDLGFSAWLLVGLVLAAPLLSAGVRITAEIRGAERRPEARAQPTFWARANSVSSGRSSPLDVRLSAQDLLDAWRAVDPSGVT